MSEVCFCCKASVPPGATKCRKCGEWVDGKRRIGIAESICIAFIVAEWLVMIVVAFLWVPTMRAMFRDFGSELPLPRFTVVVMSRWWIPAWMVVMVGVVVLSTTIVKRKSVRAMLLASVLAIGVGALVATWVGSYLPIFDLAGNIKSD